MQVATLSLVKKVCVFVYCYCVYVFMYKSGCVCGGGETKGEGEWVRKWNQERVCVCVCVCACMCVSVMLLMSMTLLLLTHSTGLMQLSQKRYWRGSRSLKMGNNENALTFHWFSDCEGQSQNSVHKSHLLKSKDLNHMIPLCVYRQVDFLTTSPFHNMPQELWICSFHCTTHYIGVGYLVTQQKFKNQTKYQQFWQTAK